jgi:hypothetical protein
MGEHAAKGHLKLASEKRTERELQAGYLIKQGGILENGEDGGSN